jgi:hypothetical protein
MKHEIIESENKITVKATVATRRMARDPVQAINTKDILEMLVKSGYNVEKYRAIKEGSCSNYKPESQVSDEWVFELEQPKEEVIVKPPQTTRKRSTRAKNVHSKEDKLLRNENVGGMRTQTQTGVPGQNKEIPGK